MDNVVQMYQGVPSLSLLPLMNVNFKIVDSLRIQVPNKGDYHKLMPDVFDQEAGNFTVFENNILHLPSITKVLLATGNYPQLKNNQLFVPSHFEFLDKSIIIKGDILELIITEKGDQDG